MRKDIYRIAVALLAMTIIAGATTSVTAAGLGSALCQLKGLIVGIIPTIALIMFLLAGLVYAAGQTFGAEMKAKAQGWSMSLLVGGIIGILIAVIAPFLVDTFVSAGGGLATGASRLC